MGIFTIFGSGLDAAHILIFLGAWLIAITVGIVSHEFAHSYAAVKMGDNTPKVMGRLSLNPARHFDLVGFLFLVLLGFGWSKPVPVNPNNFRNVRKGEIVVSLSGVLTNLVLFVVFTFLFVVFATFLPTNILFYEFLIQLASFLAQINLVLAIFNILPIYPLDGFNFISAFCRYDNKFIMFMKQYSFFILLLLMLSGALYFFMSFVGGNIINGLVELFSMIFA